MEKLPPAWHLLNGLFDHLSPEGELQVIWNNLFINSTFTTADVMDYCRTFAADLGSEDTKEN